MSTALTMKLGLLAVLVTACSRTPVPTPDPATRALAAAPGTPTASASACAPGTPSVAGSPPAPGSASAPAPGVPAALAGAPSTAPRGDGPQRHATALRVERLVVARGVVDREPQGIDTLFASGERRVFAFVEVDNPERAAGELRVQFVEPDGTTEPPVDLAVGESPRWRTWAFTRRAHAPGTWKAVVRDDKGHVLASTEFAVRG